MKIKLLSVLFLFTSSIFSQIPEENLRKEFNTYINLTINQDFEKSMDYVVEDFFEIFPKEQMVSLMKQIYNNPSMEIKLEKPTILEVDIIEKINEKYYSILTYSNLMKMKLKSEDENESDEDKKMRIGLIKVSLFKKFGAENVDYNEKTDFFEIKVTKKVCSVSKNGNDIWKFVTIEKEQKYILEKFIPKEILEKI
jgi:N12 class adenine-specific DNA methylase